jgi:hypothetical protein
VTSCHILIAAMGTYAVEHPLHEQECDRFMEEFSGMIQDGNEMFRYVQFKNVYRDIISPDATNKVVRRIKAS